MTLHSPELYLLILKDFPHLLHLESESIQEDLGLGGTFPFASSPHLGHTTVATKPPMGSPLIYLASIRTTARSSTTTVL